MQRPQQGGQPTWGPPPGQGPTPSGGQPPGNAQPVWGGHPVWGPPGGHPAYGSTPSGQPRWGTPTFNPTGGTPPNRPPGYAAPPKPGIVPLRPLMFGEILDGSFQAIRSNPKAMLGAALMAQSLAAVVAAVLTAFSTTSAASIETWAENLTEQDLVPLLVSFIGGALLVSLLTLFLSAVLQGAMVIPVARSVLNRTTGFGQMWKLARSRAWPLIRLAALLLAGGLLAMLLFIAVAVLLISTAGGAGALFLIPLSLVSVVLYIWVYIKLLVAPAVVVVEELGAVDSIQRSWELTRNNWWRLLGITLVVGIMVGVIAQIVMIPVSLLPSFYTGVVSPHGGSDQELFTALVMGVATAIVGGITGAVGFAFQTSVMALLYLDLRMRRDGLDIALLQLMESRADPDGIPGRGVPVYRDGAGFGPRLRYGRLPDAARPDGAWPDGAWPDGR